MIYITRNFTGKTVGITIDTVGGISPVPIDLQSYKINWDSIEYPPTMNAIKSAWDEWAEGKNLTYELRDRPDLALPQSKPQPDWNELKLPFFMSTGYQKLIASPTNKAVLAASSLQSAVLSYISGQAPTYPLLKNFWDTLVDESPEGTLTVEDINELIAIALAARMKFSFSSNGKMIL